MSSDTHPPAERAAVDVNDISPICTQPTASSPLLQEENDPSEIIEQATVCAVLESQGRRGSGGSVLPGVVFSNDGYGSIGVGPPPQGYQFNAQGNFL